MSLQKKPVFKEGTILTHEMLNSLSEYAIDVANVEYVGYSDGVIKGCDITVAPGILRIGTGMLRVKGLLYMIKDEVKIVVRQRNAMQILIVRATEIEENIDFSVRDVNFLFVSEDEIRKDDIELCRFRLQEGAQLRNEYRDFKDMDTEFDTVCLKNAKWAAYGEASISLIILEKYAEELLKTNVTAFEDRLFLSHIYSTKGMTLSVREICLYLSWKLGQPFKIRTHHEIYRGLIEALRLQNMSKTQGLSDRQMTRRMIVD